jgi:CubicO group peptidase (beta-lactamase class C family)
MSTLLASAKSANIAAQEAVRRAIDNGQEIGIQVAAYLDGECVVNVSDGLVDPASDKRVDDLTLFNVFSVVKAVTATALHIQVERGRMRYDDLVAKHWPEYGVNGKEKTTVADILAHRAGVPQMPKDVTVEQMCDWDYMISQIADLTPVRVPGTATTYLAMTFGWLVGELVRRTDPSGRSFGTFVREELAEPLEISDLWIGLPDAAAPRAAPLINAMRPPAQRAPLYYAALPPQVALLPEVFGRADVRRAEIPAVGGVFNATSSARFWAMLANGGELDGVRLLSSERVAKFNAPRVGASEPDPVFDNMVLPLTASGFYLGGSAPHRFAVNNPEAICVPGAGNSIGWADMKNRFAMAVCHNRMQTPLTPEEDPLVPIATAVRRALDMA